MPERTSLTDTSEYREFCALAAANAQVFETFRRADIYHPIVAVTAEQGQAYLDRLDQYPTSAALTIGAPLMYPLRWKDHAPADLDPVMVRYYHDKQEVERFHGDTADMRILEIGGGFGGLASIFASHCASYAIRDLPEVRALQERYLTARGVRSCGEPKPGAYDLVISTFAFSELYMPVMEEYARNYLRPAARGWMICNFVNPAHDPGEVLALVPGARWEPEIPPTHPANRVMVWGDK